MIGRQICSFAHFSHATFPDDVTRSQSPGDGKQIAPGYEYSTVQYFNVEIHLDFEMEF
jgi:hypothetical protein